MTGEAAVHLRPVEGFGLTLEPAGKVTHDVMWQVQRWSDAAEAFVWVDSDPVPCSGVLDAELQRLGALDRGEHNVRIVPRAS